MDDCEWISHAEFDALEKAVDDEFENTPLSPSDRFTARWQFCQLLESYSTYWIRRHIVERKDLSDERALIAALDNAKLAFDFGLKLIDRRLAATSSRRVKPEAFDVDCFLRLFNRGVENAQAYALFFPARAAKTTFCRNPSSNNLETRTPLRTEQYWALQRLLPLEAKGYNPLWDLLVGLAGPDMSITFDTESVSWGDAHYALLKPVVREGKFLRTELNPSAAAPFYDHFRSLASFAPQSWSFPWASAEAVRIYYSALCALCICHLIAIYFSGHAGSDDDICERHACLLVDVPKLRESIAQLSGLDDGIIVAITQNLTYGHKTRAPDPALQWLIPVGPDQVAIPSTLVLSNAWSRNQLSLHARIDAAHFNSQSNGFERQMTKGLLDQLDGRFEVLPNVFLPTAAPREEVDLVLIDRANRTIILTELRWVLTPGDVKEILTKQSEVRAKIKQARRKLTKVNSAQGAVLQQLKCAGTGWTIKAIVVIEGYAGLPSGEPREIPIVPSPVFAEAMRGFMDLRRMHAFFCSPIWLPRKGEDYFSIREERKILGQSFNLNSIAGGDQLYLAGSLQNYINEANSMSLEKLASIEW